VALSLNKPPLNEARVTPSARLVCATCIIHAWIWEFPRYLMFYVGFLRLSSVFTASFYRLQKESGVSDLRSIKKGWKLFRTISNICFVLYLSMTDFLDMH
jgi:hypothetical protein